MKFLLSIMVVISFVSCSRGKTASSASEDVSIELADAVEYSNDTQTTQTLSDDFTQEQSLEQVSNEIIAENPTTEEAIEQADTAFVPVIEEVVMESYQVQENDTLMLVAFKVYGDYSRWREIAEYNSELLKGSTSLEKGMNLQYKAPKERFEFRPDGNPYLVKKGDYLVKISHKTYGTSKHWEAIWKNNQPLIKDPNVVFAGFTIYTPILDNTRDVAFENL